MRRVLSTDLGLEVCVKRRHSIEPVFGQIKHNRGIIGADEEAGPRRVPSGASSQQRTIS